MQLTQIPTYAVQCFGEIGKTMFCVSQCSGIRPQQTVAPGRE